VSEQPVRPQFVSRTEPLLACGMFAIGPCAERLAQRLLQPNCDTSLLGASTGDHLFVLGAAEFLPWVDGVVYLGEAAPGLLLPTTLDLAPCAQLVRKGLARLFPKVRSPIAVLPEGALVSLEHALPLKHVRLRQWIATRGSSTVNTP
jgi:hypothetical protein